jgi:hypothetical protein
MDTNQPSDVQSNDRAGIDGLTPVDESSEPYDASLDPRTGRPPSPLEAQRLAREHQMERVKNAQTPEEVTEAYQNDDSARSDDGAVAESNLAEDEGAHASALSEMQAPARMIAPTMDEHEKAAVDALIQEGVTRERAEALVQEHGANWETLKAAAFAAGS